MNKTWKKALIVLAVILLLLAVFVGSIFWYGRARSLNDILPVENRSNVGEGTLGSGFQSRDSHTVTLSREQMVQLLDLMDTLQYKKLGSSANELDSNYLNLIFLIEDHPYQLQFYSLKGGCLLVNDMDAKSGSAFYQILPSGADIESLLQNLFNP